MKTSIRYNSYLLNRIYIGKLTFINFYYVANITQEYKYISIKQTNFFRLSLHKKGRLSGSILSKFNISM